MLDRGLLRLYSSYEFISDFVRFFKHMHSPADVDANPEVGRHRFPARSNLIAIPAHVFGSRFKHHNLARKEHVSEGEFLHASIGDDSIAVLYFIGGGISPTYGLQRPFRPRKR